MSNDITIDWHSNQSALIADLQKQLAEQKKIVSGLQQIGHAGTAAGNAVVSGARAGVAGLREMGQVSEAVRNYQRQQIDTAREQYRVTSQAIAQQQQQKLITREVALVQRQAAKDQRDARMADIAAQREAAAELAKQKREQEDMIRQADRIRQMNRTPKEVARANYSAGIEKAEGLRQGGQLSDAEFVTERQRLIGIYKQESGLLADRARREKELAIERQNAVRDEIQWQNRLAEKARQNAEERARAGANDRHQQEMSKVAAAQRSQTEQSAMAAEAKWREELAAKARHHAGERAVASANDLHAQQMAEQVVRRRVQVDQEGLAVAKAVQTAQERHAATIAKLNSLVKQGAISQETFKRAVKQANETLSAQEGFWSRLPEKIQSSVSGATAMLSIVSLVKTEYQDLIRVQTEARDANVTYAEAAAGAKQNLDETMTGDEFDKWIMDTSRKTGQTPLFLAKAAGGVLGAKGDAKAREALGSLEEVVPLERHNADDAKFVAAGVMQQHGMSGPGVTRKQVLGQQIAAKIASRVESSSSFGQYMTYGSLGAKAYGDTSKDWYVLASHLANQGGDPTGQTSGSGAVDWEKDLLELHKQLSSDGQPGLGSNTIERMRNLAFDPRFKEVRETLQGGHRSELQKELGAPGGKMTAKARQYSARLMLLQGDEAAWKQIENLQKQIPDLGPGAERFVDKQLKDLDSSPQRITVQNQTNTATAERLKISNTPGARIGTAREGLDKNLTAGGANVFQRFFAAREFDVATLFGRRAELAQADQQEALARTNEAAAMKADPVTAKVLLDAARELRESNQQLRAAVLAMQAQAPQAPRVQVVMPPGNNDRPDQPAARGLSRPAGPW